MRDVVYLSFNAVIELFFSHFCFLIIFILSSIVLSVSFLMAIISPRSCFSVVFERLYRCVNAVFDAGKSSFSLFSRYI